MQTPAVAEKSPLDQLQGLLEDWGGALGATGARLLLLPAPCRGPCDPQAQPYHGACQARLPQQPCGGSPAPGQVVAAWGSTSPQPRLCLLYPAPPLGVLALQVSNSQAHPVPEWPSDRLAAIAAPVIVLAAEAMGRAGLLAQLGETRERLTSDLHGAIRAQEDEREWLAMEIHDRVAQVLAAIFQQFQALESLGRAAPDVRQAAIRGSRLTRDVIREARSLMNGLSPPLLDELGLVSLLEEELHHLERDLGCLTEAVLTCPGPPPKDLQVTLYRIFHEALSNIRRHARPSLVRVSLDATGGAVRLEVQDDGVGFRVEEALGAKGIGGLVTMRRRTELAGGAFLLSSAPGRGTRLAVSFPWPGDAPTPGGGQSSQGQ